MSVFEEKKYFDKNRAQDGISIKNPLNPEHKTKLYTAKKIPPPYFAYIETISSIKVTEWLIINPQMKKITDILWLMKKF